MPLETTADLIEQRLQSLAPLQLELEDESEFHAGHVGAASGGGHFRLRMVSESFTGVARMARHRLVYDLLHDLMQREIHALAMTLLAPSELDRAPATRQIHLSGN